MAECSSAWRKRCSAAAQVGAALAILRAHEGDAGREDRHQRGRDQQLVAGPDGCHPAERAQCQQPALQRPPPRGSRRWRGGWRGFAAVSGVMSCVVDGCPCASGGGPGYGGRRRNGRTPAQRMAQCSRSAGRTRPEIRGMAGRCWGWRSGAFFGRGGEDPMPRAVGVCIIAHRIRAPFRLQSGRGGPRGGRASATERGTHGYCAILPHRQFGVDCLRCRGGGGRGQYLLVGRTQARADGRTSAWPR